MAVGKLVAARYLNGRVIKGRTIDFHPDRAFFYVDDDVGPPVRVELDELKAVFFIKSLAGDPAHRELKNFPDRRGPEQQLWIEFSDGEEMAGWSMVNTASRDGFFLFPTDEHSNIERAYVFRSSLVRILSGEQAQAAAVEHENHEPSADSPAQWDRLFEAR